VADDRRQTKGEEADHAEVEPGPYDRPQSPGGTEAGMGSRSGEQGLANEERQERTTSATTSATAPKMATLAPSTCGRLGAAEKVARMVPVPYSALITSTPSTPIASWQNKTAVRLTLVGSKLVRLASDMVAQWARVSAVANALMPIPTTTVRPSVHIVDRTVRSFVHSHRRRPESP
jgi:hypothetical protein